MECRSCPVFCVNDGADPPVYGWQCCNCHGENSVPSDLRCAYCGHGGLGAWGYRRYLETQSSRIATFTPSSQTDDTPVKATPESISPVVSQQASPKPQEEVTPSKNEAANTNLTRSRSDDDLSVTDPTLIGSGTISSVKESNTYVSSVPDRVKDNKITEINDRECGQVSNSSTQQREFDDVDIRSLVSEENDNASRTSSSLPAWATETENAFIGVFSKNSVLSPLYATALQLMPDEHFINNFGRLLKNLHRDLQSSNDLLVTRQFAKILQSAQRRDRIARLIVARQVSSQNSWNEVNLADMHNQENRAYANVEGWLKSVDTDITPMENGAFGLASERKESGSDIDSSSGDEVTFPELAEFPRLDLVVQTLVKGAPFQNLLTAFKELLLPHGLLKELLPTPRECITFDAKEKNGFLPTIQGVLEDVTALEWDWWPLPPRMRPLKPGETRVHWRCFCGIYRWRELKFEQQEILEDLLERTPPDHQPRPLCASLKNIESTRYRRQHHPSPQADGQSIQDTNPGAHVPSSSRGAMSSLGTRAIGPQPGANISPQTGGNGSMQLNPGVSSITPSSAVAITGSHKQLWVNFGVDCAWSTTELDQIGGRYLVSDSTFLRNLRIRHNKIRGWATSHLSFRILSHWEFLRFKRLALLPPQTIDDGKDLPTSSDYEYNPRPPIATPDRPGITKHEFEVYVRLCLEPCWSSTLSKLHMCRTVDDSAIEMIERLPKFNKALQQHIQKAEDVWGIRARYKVSAVRVITIHVAILCASLGVWIWWQWKHLNDLQGAAVVLTVAFLLISTFWSATGVLKDFR